MPGRWGRRRGRTSASLGGRHSTSVTGSLSTPQLLNDLTTKSAISGSGRSSWSDWMHSMVSEAMSSRGRRCGIRRQEGVVGRESGLGNAVTDRGVRGFVSDIDDVELRQRVAESSCTSRCQRHQPRAGHGKTCTEAPGDATSSPHQRQVVRPDAVDVSPTHDVHEVDPLEVEHAADFTRDDPGITDDSFTERDGLCRITSRGVPAGVEEGVDAAQPRVQALEEHRCLTWPWGVQPHLGVGCDSCQDPQP